MKKINSLILIFITAVISVNAQNPSISDLKLANEIHLEVPPCNKIKVRNSDFLLDSMIGYSQINGIWKKDSKNYYTYNKKNLLINDSLAIWSEITTPGWYPGSMSLFTYNSADDVTILKKLTWSDLDNKWRNDTVRIISEYSGKQLTKITQAYFNSDSSKYVAGTTEILTYNAQGKLELRSIYIPDGSQLALLGRIFYKYENDNLSSWLLQVTLDKGVNWENYTRQFFHYQGSVVDKIITEFYDENKSNFEPYLTEEYEYNNDGLLSHRNLFFWDEESWVFENRYDYFYSEKVVTSTPETPSNQGSGIIMANPFHGGDITIITEDKTTPVNIEIFNNLNQLQYSGKLNGQKLTLPPFSNNGIYYLSASQSGKVIGTRKFISMH